MRLTPAGESLLHHARTVLFGLERMQGELAEYTEGVRGHVRVHANISAIVQFLPEDLGAFAQQHSQIKIDLPGREISMAHLWTPYPEGLYRINAAHLYVSRGIGTTFTPVRLNAPPEVTVFHLH